MANDHVENANSLYFIQQESLSSPFIDHSINNGMPFIGLEQGSHAIATRGLIDSGGKENIVEIGIDPLQLDQKTLLRKDTHEIGRLLKTAGDLHSAPIKWLRCV